MLLFFRKLRLAMRLPRLARLIELAKQMDEVLIGGKLSQDTRQLLQQKRDALEDEIRDLRTV
jgi:hypothetical protein